MLGLRCFRQRAALTGTHHTHSSGTAGQQSCMPVALRRLDPILPRLSEYVVPSSVAMWAVYHLQTPGGGNVGDVWLKQGRRW